MPKNASASGADAAATAASDSEERKTLIKTIWPDKLLYASIMLFVTGTLGMLYGMGAFLINFEFGDALPGALGRYPPWATAILSAVAGVLGYMALERQDPRIALAGGVVGFFSMGMLGLGSFFSLVALMLVFLAFREGEGILNPHIGPLTVDMWPDKSLAASMLLQMMGIVNLAWGFALVLGATRLETELLTSIFGWGNLAIGGLALYAALQVYNQREAEVGVIAALGGILSFGAYVLSPILAVGALVLIRLAHREEEFEDQSKKPSSTPATQ